MKVKTLARAALCVPILLTGLSHGGDLGSANTERSLRGGLGYDFSLSWVEANSSGFSPSNKQEPEGMVSKLAVGDFFPLHTLSFTVNSKKLLKIRGARGYVEVENAQLACSKDFAVVMEGIKSKYPDLKPVRLFGTPPPLYSYLCERTSRLEGPAGAIAGDKMEGRCIKLECLGDSQRSYLMIEYWDMDLYDLAQRERSEWRRQNQEQVMREKGFDPDKL